MEQRALDALPGDAAHGDGADAAPSAGALADGQQSARIVGGVMLGAAVAALVQQFVPSGPLQPIVALFIALLSILSAWRLGRAGDTADAAGLAAATAVPFFPATPAPLGLVVAGLALFVTIAQRGRSPLALLAAATFFVGVRHAAGVDLLLGETALPAVGLFLALAAYGAFVASQRAPGDDWSPRAAALVGALLVLCAFPLLDAAGVQDAGIAALCLATLIGALLAAGVALGLRALAATMGAILPVAVLAFALLALGPALAAIVLLCIGSALLWQAEHVRAYLRGPTA